MIWSRISTWSQSTSSWWCMRPTSSVSSRFLIGFTRNYVEKMPRKYMWSFLDVVHWYSHVHVIKILADCRLLFIIQYCIIVAVTIVVIIVTILINIIIILVYVYYCYYHRRHHHHHHHPQPRPHPHHPHPRPHHPRPRPRPPRRRRHHYYQCHYIIYFNIQHVAHTQLV